MKIVTIIKTWINACQNRDDNHKAKQQSTVLPQVVTSLKKKPFIVIKNISISASLSALLLFPQFAHADGIYMGDIQTQLTPASISLLTAPTRTEGVVAGDIIEIVTQATVFDSGGGPATFFTAYVPPGVEVLGASFVTDASGAVSKAPEEAGLAANGWGARGSNIGDYAAPYTTPDVFDVRMNDLHGDTGIFYSTDALTQLVTDDGSNIAKGPVGDPGGTASTSNGIDVSVTYWGDVDAFNQWDANQTIPFGEGTAIGSGPTPFVVTDLINNTGDGAGSTVAGPQSGYKLDNTGNVGPWNRIQYPGSTIGDISDGPATETNEEPIVQAFSQQRTDRGTGDHREQRCHHLRHPRPGPQPDTNGQAA